MDLRVVDDVAAAFCELVRAHRPRTLALSGGETARRCYERLAQAPGLDWEQAQVLFGDERWVDVDHPDSNEGMARAALLDQVPVRRIHSLRRAGPDRDAAAQRYEALLRDLPHLDVVHLGLGADGHTASLFPGSPALEHADRLVVSSEHPAHRWPRLTFTLPAIELARTVVVTVAGAQKHRALREVRAGADVPASHLVALGAVWLVDHSAAEG